MDASSIAMYVYRPHVSKTDILNQLWVNLGLLHHLLENLENDAVEGSVLQASFPAFRQGRSGRKGDDNVVGVLLSAVMRTLLAMDCSV